MAHNEVSLSGRTRLGRKVLSYAAAFALAVGAVGVSVISSAEPAQAACSAIGTKGGGTPSWTRAKSNDCEGNVQARVYRYIVTYPTAYDGPQSRNSYVSASAGVASGHALRIQVSAGSSSWTSWSSF